MVSRDCGDRGYCCGNHANMYCCVSYFDRVPPPVPVVGSAADCITPVDNGGLTPTAGVITFR